MDDRSTWTMKGHLPCDDCGGPGGGIAYAPGPVAPTLPYAGAPVDPLAPSKGRWLCEACVARRILENMPEYETGGARG